jgi:two-component system nitrogen regulation response regulator GlnG
MSAARPKLLLVDDGERYAELAHALLRDYDYATRCALPGPCWQCPHRRGCTLTHAHDVLEAGEALANHPDIDLLLLDVAFDLPEQRLLREHGWDLERCRRLQGLLVLRKLRGRFPELPVVLMTSREQLELEHAREALEADEFVTLAGENAFDARALSSLIERVLARKPRASEGAFFWGTSPAMSKLRQKVVGLARTSLPMLLLGETGTGKSALCEHVIHPESGRNGPFVQVDLAALPENLIAAELFGTVRGAFSGAIDRRGRFEQAAGGTLFLDEIANLPLEAQRTLLLVLQSGRIARLGEGVARPVDVKLVTATNADLEALVRGGRFRADLYARLNPAARAALPPLRERLSDLGDLAAAALARGFGAGSDRALLERYMRLARIAGPPRAALQFGVPERVPRDAVIFTLGPRSSAALHAHGWPGNVRELSLLVLSAAVLTLGDALHALEHGRGARGEPARVLPVSARLVRELLAQSWPDAGARASGGAASGMPAPAASLHELSRALEKQMFERLFAETQGDFEQMAAQLLHGDARSNARRVQLRFNQLGLRARALRAGRDRRNPK